MKESQDSPIGRPEKFVLLLIGVLLAILRLWSIYHYRFDSDEPQHLHVAWSWTQGLVQYRDTFDNHTPLFHLLLAPIVALIGERSNILLLARWAMLPLFAITLWAVQAIGQALISRRAGLWAALLLGFYPGFFLPSVEFRTDDLWVMLLALALLAILGKELNWKRSLLGGFLLGLALSVSFKTILMLTAISLALLLLPLVTLKSKKNLRKLNWQKLLGYAGTAIGGFLLPPLALILLFRQLGALPSMFYCVISHNIVPNESAISGFPERPHYMVALIGLPLLAFYTRKILGNAPRARVSLRPAFLFLLAGIYFLLARFCWPMIQPQTLLSIYPTLILGTVMLPFAFQPNLPVPGRWLAGFRLPPWMLVLIALVFGYFSITEGTLWEKKTKWQCALLADVLRLTDRQDYVLDRKGEFVFRRRAFYYVLETFTEDRLDRGLIPNTIVKNLIDTHTCVVATFNTSVYPVVTRRFLTDNYLWVGRLNVAGQMLKREPKNPDAPIPFEIAIATSYIPINPNGFVSGMLDGKPWDKPRELAPGRHLFIPSRNCPGDLAVIWARAAERDFSPFHLKPDNKHHG